MFDVFKEFKSLAENQYGETIKCPKTDGEGEYTSLEFEIF